MLNIGSVAKTFGLLPSHVLAVATTYDLMIADVMSSWEQYQIDKATNKTTMPDLNESEMLAMIQKVKQQ